jgi:hypothetical protein
MTVSRLSVCSGQQSAINKNQKLIADRAVGKGQAFVNRFAVTQAPSACVEHFCPEQAQGVGDAKRISRVANGRKALGDDFPPGKRDNPTRIIVPIPVDPENDQFSSEPNNRFPIISSTGIDGKGCHVVDAGDDGNAGDNGSMDNNNTGSSNDVIPDTTSDQPLPNTGGVPLYSVIVSGLVFAGAGVLLFSTSAFQHFSPTAADDVESAAVGLKAHLALGRDRVSGGAQEQSACQRKTNG